MNIAYIFIPFAYNGPCVTECGPKVMQYEISKRYGNEDMFLYQLEWNETPKNYISRVYNNILCLVEKYDKLIVFGGNHLAILPVYWLAETMQYNSITFDAHRDYIRSKGLITHASFLRYVNRDSASRYIVGFRDYIKEDNMYDFFNKEISAEALKKEKLKININSTINFIDIDVDFFDENIFPYTYCKKANGFSESDFYKIIQQLKLKDLRIIAFSEYIQILDGEKIGVEFILRILKKLLTK